MPKLFGLPSVDKVCSAYEFSDANANAIIGNKNFKIFIVAINYKVVKISTEI